jgi:hypothetical protein
MVIPSRGDLKSDLGEPPDELRPGRLDRHRPAHRFVEVAEDPCFCPSRMVTVMIGVWFAEAGCEE